MNAQRLVLNFVFKNIFDDMDCAKTIGTSSHLLNPAKLSLSN